MRSTRRLQRTAGRRLCLTIRLRPGQRKVFRATFRVRAGVTAQTITNGATADVPDTSAPHPPEGTDASPFPAGGQRRRRVDRDSRTIGVLSEQARRCPATTSRRARVAC